jgi:hypothetical protein
MGIHDLPKKWHRKAHGDAGLFACGDVPTFSYSDACRFRYGQFGCRISVPAGTEDVGHVDIE